MASSEDFANLEAWKLSQQKTIELIIDLLPPEQQEVQREQIRLMRQLQKLPIQAQKGLFETSKQVPLPRPEPTPEPTVHGSKLASLSMNAKCAEERIRVSDDFATLKSELAFLEDLQKLISLKTTPQQQIERLTEQYQQLQNLRKQPIAVVAQTREPERIASCKESQENDQFVKEQMAKYAKGEPNFVGVRDTHYRIKAPHGKHCYLVCKKCHLVFTSRHFKNHYKRHEMIESPSNGPASKETETVQKNPTSPSSDDSSNEQ